MPRPNAAGTPLLSFCHSVITAFARCPIKESEMPRLHPVLLASTLLACVHLAHAQDAPTQGGADITLHPPQAAPLPYDGATDPALTSGQGAPETSGGIAVGTIVQTAPPTQMPSAASMSNDPLVQRREARAQARQEYRARLKAAREQYRADLHAADALLQPQQSGY
jgi:hypothetical protein